MQSWTAFAHHMRKKFVLLPNRHPRVIALWALLLLAAFTYDAVTLPAKLAFIGDRVDTTMCVLDVLVDLVLLADVGLRFILSYFDDGKARALLIELDPPAM